MLNLNPKQRPSGEFVAKQLNKILQYVVEKGQHAIDFDALMSPQSVNSKEAVAASNLVNEGLTVFAKDYLSQNPLSDAYDDEDDLVIVNNNEEFDFDDDDEDEFQDIDDLTDKRDRSLSLTGASSKVNTGKGATISVNNTPNFGRFQIQSASQITSLDEDKSRTDIPSKHVVHDITNVDHSIHRGDPGVARSISTPYNGKSSDQTPVRPRQGLVLYTFEPENPGELAVEADDLIDVITIKGEWVECLTKDRRHGWVPFNYVHIQE